MYVLSDWEIIRCQLNNLMFYTLEILYSKICKTVTLIIFYIKNAYNSRQIS